MKCKQGRHATAFILLFLAEKPAYGLELLKKFETELSHSKMDSAGIYRALKVLEKDGLVVSSWDTSKPGAAKKNYSITQAGYEELENAKTDIEFKYTNLNFFLNKYKQLMKEK